MGLITAADSSPKLTGFERVAEAFNAWAERWIPDAFIFALIASIVVFLVGLIVGQTPAQMVSYWGKDFWTLLTFGMQMVLIIVTGFVLATSPPVRNVIDRLAAVPKTERGAILWCAVFSMATSWLNWGFSLIFASMLARALARRLPRVDYRALAITAYIAAGLGIEQNGLSSSADLLVATPGSMPPALQHLLGGIIPVSDTIFRWQTLAFVVIEFAIVSLAVWLLAPRPERSVTASDLGVRLDTIAGATTEETGKTNIPSIGTFLEHSPILTLLVVAVGVGYLASYFAGGGGLAAINLNIVNLIFLLGGMLLHWRPRSFVNAVTEAVPATHGVILQFPFYAGIFGMIALSPIASTVTHFFVNISTQQTFPGIVALYSGILGLFVPSAGSKFFLEAPYILSAAHALHANASWVIVCYGAGEAMANLIQPFWMLPVLGILGLKAKHLVGFGLSLLCVVLPLTIVLSIVLGLTLHA